MADRDELISQFVGIISCDEDKARFFLEANQWDLNAAMSDYYENAESGNMEHESRGERAEATAPEHFSEPIRSTGDTSAGRSVGSGSRRIATLGDFGNKEEGSDDDDLKQNFFAGGEKSGVVVQGPSSKKKPLSLVDDIIQKAAKHGPAPEEEAQAPKKANFFTGSGYKLGSEEVPSTMIPSASSSSSRQTDEDLSRPAVRYLTFWRNGFSIDDGPLLGYDDPKNQEFLNAINSGLAPTTLLNVQMGQQVDLRVARRMDEDYQPPPKAPPKPFGGAGHRLGSPSPTIVTRTTPSSSSTQSSTTSSIQIDQSQPITSLQIRFADGSKVVAKFNHTHTIRDVRQFIDERGQSQRQYVLQTTFPTKELSDDTLTLAGAGLLNAVIVQRYL
ncbi:uncharacterized protein VTP21DRAFT_10078 [Calcarisporiella thermophila]|uniref:uncharacterized protein n=1 Tax=Calcarisporiella thermophila TaxID=911321 RepID=UPI0037420191